MTEVIIVDSSSIISLSSNCLLGILSRLKSEFDVRFVVGRKVLNETVVKAIDSKKFRLEGFRILELIKSGVIEFVENDDVKRLTDDIIRSCNKCFVAKGNPIQIIHWGEAEMLALAKHLGARVVLMDERTTRLFLESPESLRERQEKKLHTRVDIVSGELEKVKGLIGDLKVVRSIEVGVFAFENGFLASFEGESLLKLENKRQRILAGVLWGLKLKGCAVTVEEIDSYLNLVK
jgi:predicted nucleic acid-binding protein